MLPQIKNDSLKDKQYTYIPVFGKYVVVAPSVCSGRPILFGSGLTTEQVANLATLDGVESVAEEYRLRIEAVKEAVQFQSNQVSIKRDQDFYEKSACTFLFENPPWVEKSIEIERED